MKQKSFETEYGTIKYYINDIKESPYTLIFLPGLTADHKLFEKQLDFFKSKYRVITWDAPGHAASRPFELSFLLDDKAKWLKGILEAEEIDNPVLIGQSMGGYVGQMFIELFPGTLKGYVSIDSAPLKKEYMTSIELWLLDNCEWMYKMYPWKRLLKDGAAGCSETEYGQKLMMDMMLQYGKNEYCHLVGHGYHMLADAIKRDLPYDISCPAILICGERDKAGSAKKYNEKWTKESGIKMHWIKEAGHNSNTDKPEEVNHIIDDFLNSL